MERDPAAASPVLSQREIESHADRVRDVGWTVVEDVIPSDLRERLTAAVDVVDTEPLPADSPWWDAPGLLVSPHVGGASSAMWPRAHRLVAEQLHRYAAGEPLHNQMTGAY